ncbi:MAG: CbrC family protein [Deltaproteobacteria bacterium]|nr:CbrC family protein [Deltaproteobacteria bacterium]
MSTGLEDLLPGVDAKLMEDLPRFTYHPDPIRTGVIEPSSATCVACDRARGWIYTGPVYAHEELDSALCPWCIADGSAAERFDASFVDGHYLAGAVADGVIDEVRHRTPGYVSWQGDRWAVHCGDACECHGDLPREVLARLDEDAKAFLWKELELDERRWTALLKSYRPGGQPARPWKTPQSKARSRGSIEIAGTARPAPRGDGAPRATKAIVATGVPSPVAGPTRLPSATQRERFTASARRHERSE